MTTYTFAPLTPTERDVVRGRFQEDFAPHLETFGRDALNALYTGIVTHDHLVDTLRLKRDPEQVVTHVNDRFAGFSYDADGSLLRLLAHTGNIQTAVHDSSLVETFDEPVVVSRGFLVVLVKETPHALDANCVNWLDFPDGVPSVDLDGTSDWHLVVTPRFSPYAKA